MDWKLIRTILGFCGHPPAPNLRDDGDGALHAAGGSMGTLVLGPQGSGKTYFLAGHLVERAIREPDSPIFVLDWSGSITDTFMQLVLAQAPPVREQLLQRIVYDELGNKDLVIPLPEFSHQYGTSAEEQVQRVSQNLQKLSGHLIEQAPVLGGVALTEIAPEVFRLAAAIADEHGACWQVTEAKRLLLDAGAMARANAQFGHKVPQTQAYIKREFLNRDLKPYEKELRTYVLRAMLGLIEPREVRARLGYPRPGWTPREAIRKGLIILVSGKEMINQEAALHYLFTQAYSLVMAEINRRSPGDPNNRPVILVLDEVYALIQIKGMAREVGQLAPLYRSRRLELYLVIQALWQLEEGLRERVWSLGNVVCFGVLDFFEATEVAKQLFKYEPTQAKLPARTPHQNPTAEPDHGQYTTLANWLQSFQHRECVMRRYVRESLRDPFIRHVARTRDLPPTASWDEVQSVKDSLLRERGVPVREALEVVDQRRLPEAAPLKPPQL